MNTKQKSPVEAFLKLVQKDGQLRQQLDQIKMTGAARTEEIVRIAEAEGFSFTAKEYDEAIRARSATKSAIARELGGKECLSVSDCAN